MERVKFLDLTAQYRSIKGEIDEAIFRVIENSAFIGGEFVENFEREFTEFIGIPHALGVANGTDALEIALEALELPKGAQILVPANSFAASAEAVIRNGNRVVFVDCDEGYTMDIADLRAKISPNTCAIMPVHLYGHSADMGAIMELARAHNLRVIEDCAQAHGASFNGQKVGTFGDVACFSFYPGKNLGAYGDGGAIVSADSSLISRARQIAHHGAKQKYFHLLVGRNSRLDGLQASILSAKLHHLDSWSKRRREIANYYLDNLQNIESIALPKVRNRDECVWHLFVIRVQDVVGVREFLDSCGIESALHYPLALPKQEAFLSHESVVKSATPNACAWDSSLVSLPMGEHLRVDDAKRVVDALRAFANIKRG